MLEMIVILYPTLWMRFRIGQILVWCFAPDHSSNLALDRWLVCNFPKIDISIICDNILNMINKKILGAACKAASIILSALLAFFLLTSGVAWHYYSDFVKFKFSIISLFSIALIIFIYVIGMRFRNSN